MLLEPPMLPEMDEPAVEANDEVDGVDADGVTEDSVLELLEIGMVQLLTVIIGNESRVRTLKNFFMKNIPFLRVIQTMILISSLRCCFATLIVYELLININCSLLAQEKTRLKACIF